VSLIAERKIFMLEDGEWNASCAKALRKIDLDAASLADDGFDGQQADQRAVPFEGGAVAELAVEAERDERNTARGRPCRADGVGALMLRGRNQRHRGCQGAARPAAAGRGPRLAVFDAIGLGGVIAHRLDRGDGFVERLAQSLRFLDLDGVNFGRVHDGPSTLLGHRFTVENCAAYRPDVMSALEWFGDRPLWNSSGWLRTIAN